MSKSIQLKDQSTGLPCVATLRALQDPVTREDKEVYEFGPLGLSIEDLFRWTEHALINGPAANIHRQKFINNVGEYTTGEGVGGVKVFRPSIRRSLAGTVSGL